MTVSGQFSCPPAGSFVAVYGQFLVSAVTWRWATRLRRQLPARANPAAHTRRGDTHPLAKTVDLASKAAKDHWLPFLVDTGDSTSHVEDSWVGRALRVGQATVRVRGVVPRCGVVHLGSSDRSE
jgi:hypothetical protein